MNEGDIGSEVFILKKGSVEVVKGLGGTEVVLTTLKTGDFFGEMALFGNKKRSASIRAKTDINVVVISEAIFRTQFKKVPDWFSAMFQVLVNRIRQMDAKIVTEFKMGIEFSILSLMFLLIEKYGEMARDNTKSLSLKLAITRMNKILGLAPTVIKGKLQEFAFIKLIKLEEKISHSGHRLEPLQ